MACQTSNGSPAFKMKKWVSLIFFGKKLDAHSSSIDFTPRRLRNSMKFCKKRQRHKEQDSFIIGGVYDTSSKQRVPSWCDRILFKSTVGKDYSWDDRPMSILRSFGNFTPLTRSRAPSMLIAEDRGIARPQLDSPNLTIDRLLNALKTNQSKPHKYANNVESRPLSPRAPQVHNSTIGSGSHEDVSVRTGSGPPTIQLEEESDQQSDDEIKRVETNTPDRATIDQAPVVRIDDASDNEVDDRQEGPSLWRMKRSSTLQPRRWWSQIGGLTPPFSRAGSQMRKRREEKRSRKEKGRISCLKYDTLDDQSMHDLRGRSDHRPVIGSYAVYI